ncbi:MAG: AAA family ATPase [Solirubrobacteraceae bacterium]|nr:AAA family ATPase [Solirubrobacteraceae bacterium]
MRLRRAGAADPAGRTSILVVIGPAGSGKSTVAAALADELGWRFEDADALHSPDALDKIAAGEPLTEADRAPWLARVADVIDGALDQAGSLVIACSALRRAYRDELRRPAVEFIHLGVPEAQLAERLRTREAHFAGPEILASQLEIFEPLEPHERGLTVDGALAAADVVDSILASLVLSA